MSISFISKIVQIRTASVVVSTGTANELRAITLLTEDNSEAPIVLTLVEHSFVDIVLLKSPT